MVNDIRGLAQGVCGGAPLRVAGILALQSVCSIIPASRPATQFNAWPVPFTLKHGTKMLQFWFISASEYPGSFFAISQSTNRNKDRVLEMQIWSWRLTGQACRNLQQKSCLQCKTNMWNNFHTLPTTPSIKEIAFVFHWHCTISIFAHSWSWFLSSRRLGALVKDQVLLLSRRLSFLCSSQIPQL